MLNIVITAGGTAEDIDGIRKITNISTGTLGMYILKNTLDYLEKNVVDNYKIHYILHSSSKKFEFTPSQEKNIQYIYISDVESVYNVVDKITKNIDVDLFIHSMAISDFTYNYSVSVKNLVSELYNYCKSADANKQGIEEILLSPKLKNDSLKKISSADNLIIGLTTTPKVIKLVKKNNPKTFLVGFKLLGNVTDEELIQAANKQVENAKCDLVLANRISNISVKDHKGLLIKDSKVLDSATGKDNVAKMIVETSFSLMNKNK
ncbi:MAG: phosphopantothenoylcysteine decarboxylase [Bacteroidales bacterium]|jgi:phosphopantothenate--cysteine ligase